MCLFSLDRTYLDQINWNPYNSFRNRNEVNIFQDARHVGIKVEAWELLVAIFFYSVDRTSQDAVTTVVFESNKSMKDMQAPTDIPGSKRKQTKQYKIQLNGEKNAAKASGGKIPFIQIRWKYMLKECLKPAFRGRNGISLYVCCPRPFILTPNHTGQ